MNLTEIFSNDELKAIVEQSITQGMRTALGATLTARNGALSTKNAEIARLKDQLKSMPVIDPDDIALAAINAERVTNLSSTLYAIEIQLGNEQLTKASLKETMAQLRLRGYLA